VNYLLKIIMKKQGLIYYVTLKKGKQKKMFMNPDIG